jgi:hypothetical protein
MGLSDLLNKLEQDAPLEEIMEVLQEDILLQLRSKNKNVLLLDVYNELLAEASERGRIGAKHKALTSATIYEQQQLEWAQQEAIKNAEAEFKQMLMDEQSTLSP